jgi:NADPH2:quinone reductase
MAEEQTRAVLVTAHGGTEVLEVVPYPVRAPQPGELQVRVAAAGVNFIDTYLRKGIYPGQPPFPLGTEGAGTVIALGEGVDGFAVGDAVAWATTPASQSGVVNTRADQVVPVPDGVPLDVAAAAMLQGMTAHYLVTSLYDVKPRDEVLVHAAAGGVGQLLVQLCKARGAHVVATVGTPAKESIARSLGADEVIRYDEVDDLAPSVRDASNGGVHVAYDGVGKATFDASLASLRPRGMMALFGAASGAVPPVDPQRLNSGGSLFLTRPTLKHYTATPKELRWRAGEILSAVGTGELKVEIGGAYPLDQAADAYRALESRRTTGKLLLIP